MTDSRSIIMPIAAALLAAGGLTACSPGPSSGEPDAVATGESRFEQNCSDCHGAQGRGPSMDSLRALSPDELRAAIRNHPTAGQIPQRLPANEIQQIIEYIEQ